MLICSEFIVCEFPGAIDIDFSRYPSRDYQLNWLRMYLESSFKLRGLQPSDVTDVDVERLYVQVQKFVLVSFVKSYTTVSNGSIKFLKCLIMDKGHYFNEPGKLRISFKFVIANVAIEWFHYQVKQATVIRPILRLLSCGVTFVRPYFKEGAFLLQLGV
jgi:hypothetical protein